MDGLKIDLDEQQRRGLQEYIFDLEEIKERSEELSIAHEKLKRSQDLLMSVLSCTTHGLCLIRDRTVVWGNKALADILGWDHEMLIGRTIEKLCPDAEQYKKAYEAINAVLHPGGMTTREFEFVHKNGHRVPCLLTGRVLDEHDYSRGFVLSITDFTERRHYQEALERTNRELEQRSAELMRANEWLNREIEERKLAERSLNKYREHLEDLVMVRTSELTRVNEQLVQEVEERTHAQEELKKANDYLESILKNSPDSIVIVNNYGELIKWSTMATEHAGLSFEEFKGKTASGFFADSMERDKMLAQLRRDGFVNRYEIDMKKGDGSSFPVELSISLLKDNENKTVGSVAISRDMSDTRKMLTALRKTNERLSREISARKEVEEALRKSENEYRAIFENTGTATFILDEDATISLANAEFEKLAGYSRQEIEGTKKWTEFIVEEDLQVILERDRILKGEQNAGLQQREFQFRNRDSGIRHIFLTMSKIPGTKRSVVSLLDITHQKLMEAEALKAQKLESLGILAGGIAHDFNNILTAIVGSISLSKMLVKPGGKIFDRLDETEKASLRARDLTQQLLTFSRGGKPVKKILSISALLKESATFALRGSNVKLELSSFDELWPVEVDEGQIGQVINNLVINADQAMPQGGMIRIEAENTILEAPCALPLSPGRYVKVSVHDQGVGIPKEVIDKIFDPYFTTKHKGSGLGLATVYSIIVKHCGYVSVESTTGIGTVFHIYLPASEGEVSELPDSQRETVGGKGRILVMDDDESVRRVLGEMLTLLGYEVEFAKDGAEAIAAYMESKASKRLYDAMIMDLTIPGGMGGKEAVGRLIKIDPEIRAIVSSGYSHDPVMADYKKYGFVGVVSKPYKVEELSEVLHNVLA